MVAAAFRSIFAQSDPDKLAARYDEVTDALAERLPKAAELLADAKGDVLAFSAFPQAHWRKTWSYLDSGVHHLAEARAYRWEFRRAIPLQVVTLARSPS